MNKLLPLVGLTAVSAMTQTAALSTLETFAFSGQNPTEACDSNFTHQIFGNNLLCGIVPTVTVGGAFVDSIDVGEIHVFEYDMHARMNLCHRGGLDLVD